MKPWSDQMVEDIESFAGGFDRIERPMTPGDRPALIIVDMTRAFVDSAYPSGWSPTGYLAVAQNRRLLDAARAAGLPIYFTKGYADPDYQPIPAERGRWKSAPGYAARARAIEDLPPGDVIVDQLAPQAGEARGDHGCLRARIPRARPGHERRHPPVHQARHGAVR